MASISYKEYNKPIKPGFSMIDKTAENVQRSEIS